MRIDRLRIANYRRLKHVDVELPDGLIALVGRNGSGKSTLLEAIGWCLYGNDAARTGKDLIKRRGAPPGENVTVHIAFRFSGQTYEVTRELLGKSGTHIASVSVDGALVVPPGASSQREATNYIARLFHMERDAFFTSLVARQRELSALSEATPADRKRLLMSLLRVDAIDRAIQEARQERRDARKELQGLRTAMLDLAPLRISLNEARAGVVKLTDETKALDARILALVDEVEERRIARDASRTRHEAHRALAAELHHAETRRADITRERLMRDEELAACRAAAVEAAALEPRLAELPDARARVDHLTALRERAAELDRVRRVLVDVARDRANAERDVDEATRAIAALEPARAAALALVPERSRLEQAQRDAQTTRARLALAKQRHETLQRLVESSRQAEVELAGAREEATAATESLAHNPPTALRKLLDRLPAARERDERAATEAALRAAQAQMRIQELERAIAEADARAQDLRQLGPDSPCPTCTRPLHEHHDDILHTLASDRDAATAAIAAEAAARDQARADETAARARQSALTQREQELRAKLDEATRNEARLESVQRRLESLDVRIQTLAREQADLAADPFDAAAFAKAENDERAARESLADLTRRDNAIRAQLEKLAAEEARLQAAGERLKHAEERRIELDRHAADLAAQPFDAAAYDAARKMLTDLETLRDRHSRLAATAARAPALETQAHEVAAREESAIAAIAFARERLTALAFVPADHEALERAHETAEAKLQETRVTSERLKGETLRRGDEANRIAAEIARQEELTAKATALEAQVRLLERLAGDRDQGLLPEFKDHLVGRIRPLLSTHAGRLFRDLTDGRYADLELNEDYELQVSDEGETFTLSRFSGGEGDLANLCLRLAVGQVVAERAGTEGFGFLALDEIFGSQDEVRKGNILRALASLTSRFRQILLVTHIEDVKEACEHVLRVETLDDGTSRVSLG